MPPRPEDYLHAMSQAFQTGGANADLIARLINEEFGTHLTGEEIAREGFKSIYRRVALEVYDRPPEGLTPTQPEYQIGPSKPPTKNWSIRAAEILADKNLEEVSRLLRHEFGFNISGRKLAGMKRDEIMRALSAHILQRRG